MINIELFNHGIEKGFIKLNDTDIEKATRITYNLKSQKSYNFKDPEEKVQAETFLQLAINYNYPINRIDLQVIVPRRTPSDIADIVVFDDDNQKTPLIVIECKKFETTDAEFRQAIEQGFGNANSLRSSFLWVTSKINNRYYNVKDFPSTERNENEINDIPAFGQEEIKEPTFIINGEGRRELQVLEENELVTIFQKVHDALWDGGKRHPSDAFDELNKLIFCKIYDERLTSNGRKKPNSNEDDPFYHFQNYPSDKGNAETLADRIKSIYEEGRQVDPEVFRDDIRINAKEIRTVVGYLARINLHDTDLDSKGKAFEVFLKNDIFRGKFGQYFTPRNVVKFIVEVLPIDHNCLVLDPACGSGGFLLYALDKVRQLANSKFTQNKAKEIERRWAYWHEFAQNKLFGIEISEMIARTAKMNMIIHDDGHTNVISFDGLDSIEKINTHAKDNKSKNYFEFKKDNFDFIITNPPFGAEISADKKSYLGDYDLGKKSFDWIDAKLKNIPIDAEKDKQKSQIIFIEQCCRFLRVGGILGMVIDDGILTNSSLQPVRTWIEEHYRIIAVVSLPQFTFNASDANVKSSVIFLQKHSQETTLEIKKLKLGLQDRLFAEKIYSGEIYRLQDELKYLIEKGDSQIQQINEDLINLLESLKNQNSLDKNIQKEHEKKAKDNIAKHKKTDAYKLWEKQIKEQYNEQIELIKENLNDEFLRQSREQITDYPIFMSIAEHIGYNATGNPEPINELEDIAQELKQFINAVIAGKDSFFQYAPN